MGWKEIFLGRGIFSRGEKRNGDSGEATSYREVSLLVPLILERNLLEKEITEEESSYK